jgi:hypothetical protein
VEVARRLVTEEEQGATHTTGSRMFASWQQAATNHSKSILGAMRAFTHSWNASRNCSTASTVAGTAGSDSTSSNRRKPLAAAQDSVSSMVQLGSGVKLESGTSLEGSSWRWTQGQDIEEHIAAEQSWLSSPPNSPTSHPLHQRLVAVKKTLPLLLIAYLVVAAASRQVRRPRLLCVALFVHWTNTPHAADIFRHPSADSLQHAY